jgi:pimeloyl-ACP methyl ester carboxylesterase
VAGEGSSRRARPRGRRREGTAATWRHARLALVVGLLALGSAAAGTVVRDPGGRFLAPVPEGWSVRLCRTSVVFERNEPEGTLQLLALDGAEEDAVAWALGSLVDPGLDASFAATPADTIVIPLSSGNWTRRSYQFGADTIATTSLERSGHTVVLLGRGTHVAFLQALNAATDEVLLGIEWFDGEEPAQVSATAGFDATHVRFEAAGNVLAGTLTLPPGDGPHPGAVLVAGSGPQDRDGVNAGLPGYAPLRWLAEDLTPAGFAILRFDERGVGGSTGDHAAVTTADLAFDVSAALRFLAQHARVDGTRLGVIGHSEGAMIAARLAALTPEVAFVVAIGAPAVPATDLLAMQARRLAEARGFGAEDVERAVERRRDVIELARAGEWDALEALLYQTGGTEVELLMAQLQAPWMASFLESDAGVDWRRVTVPVLALYGGLDVQVDADQNRGALVRALAEAGNDDVTVFVLPHANHLFQRAASGDLEEYGSLEMAFTDGLSEGIAAWLRERFAPSAPGWHDGRDAGARDGPPVAGTP